MSDSTQIILYGNSILITGIELALRKRDDRPVLRLYPCNPVELDTLQEGVLIYDLSGTSWLITSEFLTAHPRLQVIGLDVARSQAQIWHNGQRTTCHMDDLNDLLTTLQTQE